MRDSLYEIANSYNDNDNIESVEGTLIKLYPVKTTSYGTLQNGELQDDEGNIQKITFADCAQPMSARNNFVVIESIQSKGHGLTGVKVKDDESYGRAIWVTATANVTYPRNPNAATRPQQNQRQPQSQPRKMQPNQPPQQRSPQRGAANAAPPRATENQFEVVKKFTSSYFYVFDLVHEKMKSMMPEDKFTPVQIMDLVQRAAATIFVDVAKAGVAANWNPDQKTRRFPLPPTNPAEWRECYIEKEGSKLDGKRIGELTREELVNLHNYYDEKKINTPLAECIYQAARDLMLFQPQQEGGDDVMEDDIPF